VIGSLKKNLYGKYKARQLPGFFLLNRLACDGFIRLSSNLPAILPCRATDTAIADARCRPKGSGAP